MFRVIKNIFKLSVLACLSLGLFYSCKKEFDYGKSTNAVKTLEVLNVLQTEATVSGSVITDKGERLSARGICYKTSSTPTINDSVRKANTATLGDFSCILNNLSPGTVYYARAYATNNFGTAYGAEVSFTTKPATIPILSITTAANLLTSTTAKSGGIITNSGASNITSRGVCYSSTVAIPSISQLKTNDGIGIGTFISSLTSLSSNTRYYIRAYATNAIGTAYGDVKTFSTTLATIPNAITTSGVASITQTTAICGGDITGDGGAAITSRGVCWSNSTTSPTILNSKTLDGAGLGSFTSSLTGLTAGTTYYIRAYATNSVGTAYGVLVIFNTNSATIPVSITTTSISSVTQTTATSGGNVASDGGAAVTSRGVCWSSTTSTPTITNSKTIDGTGIGTFISSLTGLTSGTTYYVRAYATNSVGTAYGVLSVFTTGSVTLPSGISTTLISSVTQTTASSGGTITSDGGVSITSRGVCWSSSTSTPTTINSKTINGTGTGTFTSSLTGLTPGTTYYVRAYATNNVGTAYGPLRSFTTASATIPNGITTTSISSITQNTAASGGSITSDGGAVVTSRGVCWSNTTSNPTIFNSITSNGNGIGSFSSSLTGLISGTTYYVRAYATNNVGTAYGNVINFITASQLVVGQSYQGGVIAYIYQIGDPGYIAGQTHGLIATTSNQSTGVQWGCSGTSISTSTTIGTGQNNTTTIINNCSTTSIAARICDNLSFGGYTDWFLPSSDELQKLYLNRSIIGGFSNTYYWSSSQNTSTNAFLVFFGSGGGLFSASKSSLFYVRAIRKF